MPRTVLFQCKDVLEQDLYTLPRMARRGMFCLVSRRIRIRVDHVVNVIDISRTENGFVFIRNIPAGLSDWQAYAFSITSASPASGTSVNWDAILESHINP